MEPEVEASGLHWWDEQLTQHQVSFRASLFPALLAACDVQSLSVELSRDELRVVTRFCICDAHQSDDLVTKEDFRRFLARFGPLESSLSKLVACFCVNRELVPWFHGEIGRQEAEAVLATRERSDGAFLLRFSESHPTKFTLTYLKVHPPSSRTPGRREVKNCLVRNLGMNGYALTESVKRGGGTYASVRQRTYPSIGAFIQSSSGRLKYGCNQELAAVRAMQDRHSDSYSAFSTESFGMPEPPPNAASMLFSQSPPSLSSFLGVQSFSACAEDKGAAASDSYASFTLESLAPPVIHQMKTPPKTFPFSYNPATSSSQDQPSEARPTPSGPFASNDYGSFASMGQHQPEEEAQPTTAVAPAENTLHLRGSQVPLVSEEYASFARLAASCSHESQELASRGQHAISLSRSPASAASPTQPGFDSNGAYGSFASIAVTKPALSAAAASSPMVTSPSPDSTAASDYGSFASLVTELEEKKPQWEAMLGPPPPPVVVKSRPADTDIYGKFASLSLAQTGVAAIPSSPRVLQQTQQTPNPAAPPPAPNSDVYGSFDGAAAAPAVKTTPSTSALDELNVGMEFYKQKRLDDALLRFMLAQEMARATGDQVVEARALGNLGTVYLDKKNPQQAVRCYQHCLDITRAIEDTKRERTILNNLVLALVASEDLERALACCQVQLETTTNAINRRKIISRMSLLREQITRSQSLRHKDKAPVASSTL